MSVSRQGVADTPHHVPVSRPDRGSVDTRRRVAGDHVRVPHPGEITGGALGDGDVPALAPHAVTTAGLGPSVSTRRPPLVVASNGTRCRRFQSTPSVLVHRNRSGVPSSGGALVRDDAIQCVSPSVVHATTLAHGPLPGRAEDAGIRPDVSGSSGVVHAYTHSPPPTPDAASTHSTSPTPATNAVSTTSARWMVATAESPPPPGACSHSDDVVASIPLPTVYPPVTTSVPTPGTAVAPPHVMP